LKYIVNSLVFVNTHQLEGATIMPIMRLNAWT
jgi:hypothetical protein